MRGLACAAACLPAGFGVAGATGVRPLGGLVLLALAVMAGFDVRRTVAWYALVLACFIASHLLGLVIGAWGAVAVVTVIATAAYVSVLGWRDEPARIRPEHRRAAGTGLQGP